VQVAGKIASEMARTCAKIAPGQVLPAFLPHVCSVLRACLATPDLASAMLLGDELMFNLLLPSYKPCTTEF
jgi:hypothetical protein